jgi:hypothetical protein
MRGLDRILAALGAPPVAPPAGQAGQATIPLARARELMAQSEYWLAVNGIKDEQVDTYAQPSESAIAPSIPSFGGGNGYSNGHANGNGDIADQLRQMVASGQAPTLDQLQRLLPVNVG